MPWAVIKPELPPGVLNSFYNLLIHCHPRVTESLLSEGGMTNDALYPERSPKCIESQRIRLRNTHGTLRTVFFSLSVALHVLCAGFAVMVARMVSKPGKSGFPSNSSKLDRSDTNFQYFCIHSREFWLDWGLYVQAGTGVSGYPH